ncbi:hypothetical protein LCGC14_0619290 [marine sediment metagenome]|uniref:Uncharacterized protein n=1 Tax=marine sediment metagenome TaxID=412755 RepID=A0A0F9RPH7_9ZZZZ
MSVIICSKCGDPNTVASWNHSWKRDTTTALCRICYDDLSRDAKVINEELFAENYPDEQ